MAMSQAERDRLEWLKRARDGLIGQQQAAEKMGVSDRRVRQLLVEMEKRGDAVVVHGLRGIASNRKLDDQVRKKALRLMQTPEWHDFGPTFASEQLAKRHEVRVSKETLRAWMIEEGLWQSRQQKIRDVHVWRPRRSCAGELVQWDTSTHDWLEGRGEPVRYLVRLIDDATSRSWGRFVRRDDTRENMGVLGEYLQRYGRMVDTYTDRHGMFVVPPQPGESHQQRREKDRLTQIGRALRELGIGWIAARSPQAKGRVERGFRTDQDRLIKLLRLAKVKTLAAGNEFLEKEYWPEWDQDYTVTPRSETNLHRSLSSEIDVASILSHVESRVIAPNYTVPFESRHFQIARADIQPNMRGKSLRVELHLDGSLHARYNGRPVAITECGPPKIDPPPKSQRPVRKDHNAGGKSSWMQGFFDQPAPPLWQALRDAND